MQAGPVEIGRIFLQRQRFCVPIYQRHYVWKMQKQWEPFWEDVKTKAIERITGRSRRFSHYMGALVLETRGGFSASRVPTFQVVDGQQRLMTFQMFLSAARDYAFDSKFNETANQISTYLANDKPHLMKEPYVEKYKVWPTQYDRELFIDIINGDRNSLRNKYRKFFYAKQDKIYNYSHVPKLLAAYGYFFDSIKSMVESDDLFDELSLSSNYAEEILDAIWKSLVEEFKLVEITLEDGDDAQVIFETLNERSEPLLAADLVRNNIFYRAETSEENAELLFATHWKQFESQFWSIEEKQGRYKKPRIEFFLSNYIAGKIAGEINLSKLFSEYKAFIKQSPDGNKQRYPNVKNELIDLEKYGEIYKELIERTSGSYLSEFSLNLFPWDVTTVYPLVLRIWASDLTEYVKKECLDTLLSLIVRRGICGLTAKGYNKLFLSAIDYLDKSEWSSSKLSTFFIDQTSETNRFPRDNEFESCWINYSIYRDMHSIKIKYILAEIELAKRNKFNESNSLADNLTIEHIMPRNWEKSWPMQDGTVVTPDKISNAYYIVSEDDSLFGRIKRRERLLNSIGNLTLLTKPLNSSVSNGPFSEKKQALCDHSLLILNKEIASVGAWDEDAIIERGNKLFSFAKNIWKFPTVIA